MNIMKINKSYEKIIDHIIKMNHSWDKISAFLSLSKPF